MELKWAISQKILTISKNNKNKKFECELDLKLLFHAKKNFYPKKFDKLEKTQFSPYFLENWLFCAKYLFKSEKKKKKNMFFKSHFMLFQR